jgi:two-component system invasion response regulator UvrY
MRRAGKATHVGLAGDEAVADRTAMAIAGRMEKIRILIADDCVIIRNGLKQMFSAADDFAVAAESACDEEALGKVRLQDWDVLVLDMPVSPRKGLDMIRRIKLSKPDLPILVLGIHGADQYADQALLEGAAGYISGNCDGALLIEATRKIAAGNGFIDTIAYCCMPPPHLALSKREFEIFLMIVSGERQQRIANRLSLSIKTVSTHKSRILGKMGMTNAAELVRYAAAHDLDAQSGVEGQTH